MRVLSINHQTGAGPGVFAEVLADSGAEVVTWLTTDADAPAAPQEFDAVLTFGGAANPDQEGEHPWLRQEKKFLRETLKAHVPMLGVCLGAELISEAAGAPSREALQPEIGWYEVELTGAGKADALLSSLPPKFEAFQWHSYALGLPSAATELARSSDSVQAFRIGSHAWALQFYPDVTEQDFRNWLATESTSEPALALELDPEELTDETLERLAAWQQIGRGICERFLEIVASGSVAPRA